MARESVTGESRVRNSRHAFEWTFVLGAAVIVVAKFVARGEPIYGGIVASVVGIAIMAFYVVQQKREHPESEHPRLGDEVYYLGLLYTLTSLCAALVSLFLLDGGEQALEERTNEMVGSFGVALLTTMAGIVMRMPLQRRGTEGQATVIRIPHAASGSVASGSVEGSVEIEGVTVDLERYAYELRKQLQTSTNAFASHANQAILQARTTHAHMDEMMKTFHDGLMDKAKAEMESLGAIYKDIAERAEEARQRTEAQQAGIQTAMEQLGTRVKNLDESIERIRVGSGETADNLGAIGAQAKASTRALVETGRAVTEGLDALAAATEAETARREVAAQLANEVTETLGRQAEEWTEVQKRTGEALEEMKLTSQALAGLGQEARRTNRELITLPGEIHKASQAIERLAEMANASSEIADLGTQAKLVAEQLAGVAGAGRRQEEALDAAVKKLQALAEVTLGELEGQGKLKEAIDDVAGIVETVGRYGESLKDTEREIQRINTGLKGVQGAMQDEGLKLAEVLKQAITAFEEARQGDKSTQSILARVFRR